MKCPHAGLIPRLGGDVFLALLLAAAVTFGGAGSGLLAQPVILPPDAAARAYEQGRRAVRQREHTEGVRRLQEALDTGHREPRETLGTSRFSVDRYDPDYWLGVAFMELGNDERARPHLQRSLAAGLIRNWPEYLDLAARLATLEKREEARRAAARPTERPAPSPTPTPAFTPTPAPAAGATPEPAASPAPTASPPDGKALEAAVAALSTGDFAGAEEAVSRIRERSPGAPAADLLEAVAAGSRYLLEGRTDSRLLERARRALAAYRARGGSRKAEETWISPALAAVLN